MKQLIFFLGLSSLSYAIDKENISHNQTNDIRKFSKEEVVQFIENPEDFVRTNNINDEEIKKIIFKIFKNDDLFSRLQDNNVFYTIMNTREKWTSKSICKIICLIDNYLVKKVDNAMFLIIDFISENNIKISKEKFEKLLPKILYWDWSVESILTLAEEQEVKIDKESLIKTMQNCLRMENPSAYTFEHLLDYFSDNDIHLTQGESDYFKKKINRYFFEEEKDLRKRLQNITENKNT